jgi:hypothetical protein
VKALGALGVAGLILAVAVVSMDISGGPFRDVAGVVRSVGHGEGGGVPGGMVATVVLGDGEVIQAALLHPGDALPGQSVRVRVFHRLIPGGTSYEVMRPSGLGTKDTATK